MTKSKQSKYVLLLSIDVSASKQYFCLSKKMVKTVKKIKTNNKIIASFIFMRCFVIFGSPKNPASFSKVLQINTHDTFQLLFIPNWGRRLMRLSA